MKLEYEILDKYRTVAIVGASPNQERPVYEEQLPALKGMPLVKQKIDPLQFEELLDEFL